MVISGHFRALSLLCAILMSDLRKTALNLGKKEDQLRRKRPFQLCFIFREELSNFKKRFSRDRNDVNASKDQQ